MNHVLNPALTAAAVLGAVAFSAHVAMGNGRTATPPRPDAAPKVMTVEGTATLEVVPDAVDVVLTIEIDEAPSPGSAVRQLEEKRVALLDALTGAGVEAAEINVSHLDLRPNYDRETGRRIVGYRASHTVIATLSNFDEVAGAVGAAGNAGAARIATRYHCTEMPDLKRRVRTMALEAARAKAEQMTSALGVSLAGVRTVAEAPTGYGWSGSGGYANAVEYLQPSHAAASMSPELQPLTLKVTITYELD